MSLTNQTWVILYLAQLLIISLSLGALTLHYPRLILVPRLSRFLVGFCATPFVLGVWMLLLALVLPGASRWLYIIIPIAVAIALLIWYGPKSFRWLMQSYIRTYRTSKNRWLLVIIYVGVIVLVGITISKLAYNGRDPITAHDATFYLGQALPFARERVLSEVITFGGRPDGTIRHSTHNFILPAYLSHALLSGGGDVPGFPHDHAVRIAFQVPFIYLLLAMLALTSTTRYVGMGGLAIILLLQVARFGDISYASNRDAFRIIPLLLLATVLAGLSPGRLRFKLHPAMLLPPFILAAFSLSGHALGGVAVVVMTPAWLLWGLLGRAKWLNLFLVATSMGVGMLVSGTLYIRAYLETGAFFKMGFFWEKAIFGTVLWEQALIRRANQLDGATTLFERMALLLSIDDYKLSIIGLVAAVLAVILWSRFRNNPKTSVISFVGLLILFIFLPFAGIFDFRGYELSRWFLENRRYTLHWYPFAAIGVAFMIGYWYDRFSRKNNDLETLKQNFLQDAKQRLASLQNDLQTSNTSPQVLIFLPKYDSRKIIVSLGLLAIALGFTYSAYEAVNSWRTYNPYRELDNFHGYIDPLQEIVDQIPEDQNLLMDEVIYNYYLDNRAILMYSPVTFPVTQARDEAEAAQALQDLNVGVVLLEEYLIEDWWDKTPFYRYLNNHDNAVLIFSDRFRVYKITPDAAERRQITENFLRSNPNGIPLSYLPTIVNSGYLDSYEKPLFKSRLPGSNTFPMQELSNIAPPLTVSGNNGNFSFSYFTEEDDQVLQIIPAADEVDNPNLTIQFGPWYQDTGDGLEPITQLPHQEDLKIRPGQIVFVSVWAKVTAPPKAATLFVEDKIDEWEIIGTPIEDTTWKQYGAVKRIREDSSDIIFGITWSPNSPEERLEIKDLRLFVFDSNDEQQAELLPLE